MVSAEDGRGYARPRADRRQARLRARREQDNTAPDDRPVPRHSVRSRERQDARARHGPRDGAHVADRRALRPPRRDGRGPERRGGLLPADEAQRGRVDAGHWAAHHQRAALDRRRGTARSAIAGDTLAARPELHAPRQQSAERPYGPAQQLARLRERPPFAVLDSHPDTEQGGRQRRLLLHRGWA